MTGDTAAERPSCHLVCPECGADGDAPDKAMWTFDPAPAPHADYLLTKVRCETCGTSFDVAVWVVSKREFFAAAGDALAPEHLGSDARDVVARYVHVVEASRAVWRGRYETDDPSAEPLVCDVGDVEIATDRYTAIPVRTLAAARGWRKAACEAGARGPIGKIDVGTFMCVFSLDNESGRGEALHLSVSRFAAPGPLSPIEQAFLLSLFFTPKELPFVRPQAGRSFPVIHYYVRVAASSLGDC